MPRYFFRNEEDPEPIDDLIDAVMEEMRVYGPAAPEYEGLIEKLERLNELKEKKKSKPISRDTLLMVAGNLLGILIIVAYEEKHVLSSKGMNQIIRPIK